VGISENIGTNKSHVKLVPTSDAVFYAVRNSGEVKKKARREESRQEFFWADGRPGLQTMWLVEASVNKVTLVGRRRAPGLTFWPGRPVGRRAWGNIVTTLNHHILRCHLIVIVVCSQDRNLRALREGRKAKPQCVHCTQLKREYLKHKNECLWLLSSKAPSIHFFFGP